MSDDTIGKLADATAEVAKTIDTALRLGGKLGSYFSGPLRTAGLMMDQELHFIAAKRGLRLSKKYDALLADRGLIAPTRHLSPNFIVPLLGSAVLEEDDELQDAWARLLVNAGDASTPMELRTAYIEILRGMSSFDVKNLSVMARVSLDAPKTGSLPVIRTWSLPTSAKVEEGGPSPSDAEISQALEISLGNLSRLGCAAPSYGFGGMAIFQLMTVTHLGRALYLACS